MNTQLIEAKVGEESHSSTWGKFYVRGIEIVAEERFSDNHLRYTEGAAQVADGTLFTVWASAGNKRGADSSDYYILLVDSRHLGSEIDNGYGFVRGQWQVLAHGDGTVRAPRLLGWAKGKALTEALARHLGSEIKRRGVKNPAPFLTAVE